MADPKEGTIAEDPSGNRLEWQPGPDGKLGWGKPRIAYGKLLGGTMPWNMQAEAARSAGGDLEKDRDALGEASVAAGGLINGVPIIGDAIKGGTQRAAAGVRSMQSGMPYEDELKAVRDYAGRTEAEHPVIKTGAELVGGAAALAPLAATGPGALAMGMRGSVLARPLIAGASNAALGGADAAVRGQDPLQGAMVGGAVGSAAPVVGGIIGKGIVQPIAEAVGMRTRPPAGPLEGYHPAALKLARNSMRADGLTEEEITKKISELGPQGVLLDYGNNLENLAGGAVANSGTALNTIKNTLGARVGAARGNIDKTLTEALGPDVNIPEYTRAIQKQRAEASDPLYEQFRQLRIPMTPELEDIWSTLASPEIGALREAKTLMKAERKKGLDQFFTPGEANETSQAVKFNEVPTPEVWDYAKRGLDAVINRHKPYGSDPDPNKVRVFSNLKREMLDALNNHPDENIGKIYQQARQTYAEPSGVLDALRDGQNWESIHKDELPYVMQNYTPQEQRAFAQGVREKLASKLGGTARGATGTREFFLAPDNEEKLGHLIGPDKARSVVEEMERQKQFAQRYSDVAANSKTEARRNASEAIKGASSNWAEELLNRFHYAFPVTPAAYVPGVGTLKKVVGEEAKDRLGQVLDSTGKLLTTPNPQAAEILRALQSYQHPGEGAGPAASDFINILSQSAAPRAIGDARRTYR